MTDLQRIERELLEFFVREGWCIDNARDLIAEYDGIAELNLSDLAKHLASLMVKT